jgi:hypothetical protein
METFANEPSNVMTRAGTMLQLVELGLSDIDDPEPNPVRITRGLYNIAVFGRAVTNALQVLRSFDRPAFDDWYAPWLAEMSDDPLCRFFYALRTDLLKKTDIRFGIIVGAAGAEAPAVGTITVYNVALPKEHRGTSIDGSSVRDMCHLYVAYLRELVESAAPLVWKVHDEFVAANLPAGGSEPSATTAGE